VKTSGFYSQTTGEPSEGFRHDRICISEKKPPPPTKKNPTLTVTVLSWGQGQGKTDRQEGGEEIAVDQARNYLILSKLYLHLIFLHLLVLFSPLVFFFFSLG
jgi:hypothetical protein